MVVSLSTAAFDSFQSAMVSTASNDLFRNRLNIWWHSPNLSYIGSRLGINHTGVGHWLVRSLLLVERLGGILTVFIFGTIYFGSAMQGAKLIFLEQGLYGNDWSAFGAFVAAPFGGLLWGFAALAVRLTYQFTNAKLKGERCDALDRPTYLDNRIQEGPEYADADEIHSDPQEGLVTVDHKGRFF
ncbi:uncharacterized protein LY89DRAFT_742997 [Mollisia scopiformis]|uniref:Uncharacterized protein n=1 Tax=Mollisia scopiformis TaxID=149040 RepID=A0A132B4N1_MOLSC|nr:uncharacterized protein LY89DRAFT_742997 [Mollisia scopiformis]KUJ07368.1 hypothetical protein LY89DRAFT_742997 [Mollisia scopiformis]